MVAPTDIKSTGIQPTDIKSTGRSYTYEDALENIHKRRYTLNEFNKDGIHKLTGTEYDVDGYDEDGLDINGFDFEGYHFITKGRYAPTGYDKYGRDRCGYDKEGYDLRGFDRWGNKKGEYKPPIRLINIIILILILFTLSI